MEEEKVQFTKGEMRVLLKHAWNEGEKSHGKNIHVRTLTAAVFGGCVAPWMFMAVASPMIAVLLGGVFTLIAFAAFDNLGKLLGQSLAKLLAPKDNKDDDSSTDDGGS